jgi:phosphomannomutase
MSLFKAYDIRGIYGSDLNDEFAYEFAKAVAHFSKPKNIVIGYDSRNSSMKLFLSITKAIIESGCDIIHVGLVSRPMFNWVVTNYGYDIGILITASHNPKEYNGFKLIGKRGKPLYYDNYLIHIEELMKNHLKYKKKKKGDIISKDYIDEYVKFLSSHLSKDLKKHMQKKTVRLVGDCSNGSSGEIVKRFLEINGFDYELLFSEPDGNFPCHNPNPLDNSASIVLCNTVLKNKADLGFILDPDADRIRFVDEKGQLLDNNFSACVVAKNLLLHDKKKIIVHDLVSRIVLGETIRRNKGKEVISRVGFAFMNENMRKHDAIFGAEVSGHYSFRALYYLDGGLMMLVQMLNALYAKNNRGKRLSTLVKPLNKYFSCGEINYPLKDHVEKERVLKMVLDYFKSNRKKFFVKKISVLDGISVIMKDSWLNLRASNTEPLLRLRAESKNRNALEKIRKQVEKLIKI